MALNVSITMDFQCNSWK